MGRFSAQLPTMHSHNSAESHSDKPTALLAVEIRPFEIRPASLEQAETSQATRKRCRPEAAGEDALESVVLPAGCAECFSFQLCELSSMLGWALIIHLSLSYFCPCK